MKQAENDAFVQNEQILNWHFMKSLNLRGICAEYSFTQTMAQEDGNGVAVVIVLGQVMNVLTISSNHSRRESISP